jgi:thioesterase domain-containing protein
MLVSLQTSGSKAPLFFVHGMRGIAFAVGARFARMLGPDQPLFVINANGLDGRRPIIDHVQDMVLAYLQELREIRPAGPLRIGGMCAGCMVAIEIARELQREGRQTGPVVLVDPPILGAGYEKRQKSVEVSPELKNRFYREVHGRINERMMEPNCEDMPFDPRDPQQMQAAAEVAMRTTVAFARYVPQPFSGPAEAIVSEDRAIGFLHPKMPWHKLLPGPRVVHVLPCHHMELFGAGRKVVARLMKSVLDEDPASQSFTKRHMRWTPELTLEAL